MPLLDLPKNKEVIDIESILGALGKNMRAIPHSIILCLFACIVAVGVAVPSAVESPEAIPSLLKLLDSRDDDTVIAAYMSLREYYCQPPNWIGNKPVIDRESFKRLAKSWQAKFDDKSRKQILLARLEEEPTQHVLEYAPRVLPRDEAIDCLIELALSDRKERVWGLHESACFPTGSWHSHNPILAYILSIYAVRIAGR
jgi:hypothetical protein